MDLLAFRGYECERDIDVDYGFLWYPVASYDEYLDFVSLYKQVKRYAAYCIRNNMTANEFVEKTNIKLKAIMGE